MIFQDAQLSQQAARPAAATFRTWCDRARPGERLEYARGHLTFDRIKGTSSFEEAERRKLDAVADHALAPAGRNQLHLLQEGRADGDSSYGPVARVLGRGGQA
jgi:hypothetical protein